MNQYLQSIVFLLSLVCGFYYFFLSTDSAERHAALQRIQQLAALIQRQRQVSRLQIEASPVVLSNLNKQLFVIGQQLGNQTSQHYRLISPSDLLVSAIQQQYQQALVLSNLLFIRIHGQANLLKLQQLWYQYEVPATNLVIILDGQVLDKHDTQQALARYKLSVRSQQCKYTHRTCKQISIHLRNQQQYYFRDHNNYIVTAEFVNEVILSEINSGLVKQLWYTIEYLKLLKLYSRQLKYAQYVLDEDTLYTIDDESYRILDSLHTEILQTVQAFNQKKYRQLWRLDSMDLEQDQGFAKFRHFPSDYKVGIYLPIMIPLLYPVGFLIHSYLK